MSVLVPAGVIQIKELTTDEILYGNRTTSWRWEVFEHVASVDSLIGYLDGVVDGSASIAELLYASVKGRGNLKVLDLDAATPGFLRIRDLPLSSMRLRPVQVIEGLPDIHWGMYLISAAPEEWSDTGRLLKLELLDKSTVLDQDAVGQTYSVDTSVSILSAVATVIASAGETIVVDAGVTSTLSSPMVWPTGTSKLTIVNDLLGALNYNSLRVDGTGSFVVSPYVVPALRSLTYELLNVKRELVDGEKSIYDKDWARDQDLYGVPNKVVAVQVSTGDDEPLQGEYTNEDPDSPFSYQARGNRWITRTLDGVETPAGTDAEVIAFLEEKAQRSLIAASSPQSTVEVNCLPIPVRAGDIVQFQNVPADINEKHSITNVDLGAYSRGMMKLKLTELVDL
jgi:hypothetical protein